MDQDTVCWIEAYCAAVGMSEATFGGKAAGSSTFVKRLRLGKVSIEKLNDAKAYMRDNPPRGNGAE